MNAISRSPTHAPGHAPDPKSYDRIIVAFSGGKDSVACLLTLLEAGVPPERIDVYHHDVDGNGPSFMDWPSTTAYCRAVTRSLGVPLYLSWKEGGFLREMLRDGDATAPICFETPEGRVGRVGGHGPAGTRLRFPQVSANLNQRWCSAYLKIDIMAALIRNQDRFLDCRTLIVTGRTRAGKPGARRIRNVRARPRRYAPRITQATPRRSLAADPWSARGSNMGPPAAPRHCRSTRLPAWLVSPELHRLYLRQSKPMGQHALSRPRMVRAHRRVRGFLRPNHPALRRHPQPR